MAFTSAQLAHLEEMYASGVIESETADGKRVRFPSRADLWTAIQRLRAEVRGTRRTTIGYYSPEAD